MAAGHDVAASSRRKEALFSLQLPIKAKRETEKTRAAGTALLTGVRWGRGRTPSGGKMVCGAGVGGASAPDRHPHAVELRWNQSAPGLMKHSASNTPPPFGLTFAPLREREIERQQERERDREGQRERERDRGTERDRE